MDELTAWIYFFWHSCVCCTFSFTKTIMSALASCFGILTCACAWMYSNWLANDQTIIDEFTYILSLWNQTAIDNWPSIDLAVRWANYLLEFAFEISLLSFGSSHTLLRPHFITAEAKRFWSLNELKRIIEIESFPFRKKAEKYFNYIVIVIAANKPTSRIRIKKKVQNKLNTQTYTHTHTLVLWYVCVQWQK